MCHHLSLITRTRAGKLYKSNTTNLYHLIYNNIAFEFTEHEFESFKGYLEFIDEKNNLEQCHNATTRSIQIPTSQQNLLLLFNQQEFKEIKKLVFKRTADQYFFVKGHEIDYITFKN
ncbi:DUF6686 family protein [Aquimarina agarivorans]|uniref:DUF6686 family protein n=1 Tax=Aquimarina agarivorans TaxID=980584 RepID=UPI000248FDC4|nr:DUF6686 family protein [Aquimarina agarivorans]